MQNKSILCFRQTAGNRYSDPIVDGEFVSIASKNSFYLDLNPEIHAKYRYHAKSTKLLFIHDDCIKHIEA